MRTIIMLAVSNVFMTIAWYGHLKQQQLSLGKAILISWGIAFFEYCLMVPANRWGYQDGFSAFQLKMIQEVLTLLVFVAFAVFVLKEPFQWRYLAGFGCLLAAVYFFFSKG